MSQVGVLQALQDIGPMTSKELSLLQDTAIGTADRAIRRLLKAGKEHIVGWDRPAKGRPAAIHAIGPGTDARRPGLMPKTKKNAKHYAKVRMLRQRQQAGVWGGLL